MQLAMFNTLQDRLNKHGRGMTLKQLEACGVKVSAATTPVHAFIGKYNRTRVYGWHNWTQNAWVIERA